MSAPRIDHQTPLGRFSRFDARHIVRRGPVLVDTEWYSQLGSLATPRYVFRTWRTWRARPRNRVVVLLSVSPYTWYNDRPIRECGDTTKCARLARAWGFDRVDIVSARPHVTEGGYITGQVSGGNEEVRKFNLYVISHIVRHCDTVVAMLGSGAHCVGTEVSPRVTARARLCTEYGELLYKLYTGGKLYAAKLDARYCYPRAPYATSASAKLKLWDPCDYLWGRGAVIDRPYP